MTPQLTFPIKVHPNTYRFPVPARIRCDGQPLFHIWPIPARFHFIESWEAGLTRNELAIRFGVGLTVIDDMIAGFNLANRREQRQVMTGRQVARILGRAQETVARWIRKGIIRSRRQRAAGHAGYVTAITPRQLRRFLANPAHFHLYDPAQITDRYWQWIALEARSEHGQ
jgi:transposase